MTNSVTRTPGRRSALWRLLSVVPLALLLGALLLGAVACGGAHIATDDFNDPRNFRISDDATIEDTDENRAVLTVVKDYRDAMAGRNGDALRRLIARQYYENASSTDDRADDYGNEKVEELISYYLSEKVREVRYDVEVKQITTENELAHVDYEYFASFRYVADGRDHWESTRDVNRLTLVRENGDWKIAGGL